MASITKPNVFEIHVDRKNKEEINKQINEVRLTKSFLDECLEVAKKLRRIKSDK